MPNYTVRIVFIICLIATVAFAQSKVLPGMMPLLDPNDIYAASRAGNLSGVVKHFLPRVYVPNTESNTVTVIDPATYKVIETFQVGKQPQHVVPSYDLKTLWILNDKGNSLTAIDPTTGKLGRTVPVDDPYNMYYTPDGKYAVVVAEQMMRLMFRDPATMELKNSQWFQCKGIDHMDFSADGTYMVASCEFGNKIIKVDVQTQKKLGEILLGPHTSPQDVRLSPDGKVFYVADMYADGVHLVDGDQMKKIGFIPTGGGAHGLYPSRDSKVMYVSNRHEGSVSVVDFATRKVIKKWEFGNASPDMGGVSSDGKVLWLSGRYHAEVYAIDTTDGHLIARIPVGRGPHGLCVYPQPGRYSLGHTGIFR
jgi:YVTN family beta-propeller protein